jgi:hypothetical protein
MLSPLFTHLTRRRLLSPRSTLLLGELNGALTICAANPEAAPHRGSGLRIEFAPCATNAPPLPRPRRRVVQAALSPCDSSEEPHDSTVCLSSIPLNVEHATYGISRKAHCGVLVCRFGRTNAGTAPSASLRFQIDCVEAFGAPVVDRREKVAGLCSLALISPEPRLSHRSLRFPRRRIRALIRSSRGY